ncbi:hypothetical protein MAR_011277, partial [Mya arenaria]
MVIFFMDIRGMLLGRTSEICCFTRTTPPAHRAESTNHELDILGLGRLEHAPYSPDLAPMDSILHGHRFDTTDELKYATSAIVAKLKPGWYKEFLPNGCNNTGTVLIET